MSEQTSISMPDPIRQLSNINLFTKVSMMESDCYFDKHDYRRVANELARRLAEQSEELKRRDSFLGCDGCSTGDCPHDTVDECWQSIQRSYAESEARIAILEDTIESFSKVLFEYLDMLVNAPDEVSTLELRALLARAQSLIERAPGGAP